MPTAAEKATQEAVDAALAAQAEKFNTAYAAKEAEVAEQKAAREKAERDAQEALDRLEATSGTPTEVAAGTNAGTKDYVLVADLYTPTTSKPGQPFQFTEYRKGDKVPLDPEQADRLLASGDVVEVGTKATARAKGGQTTAPGED